MKTEKEYQELKKYMDSLGEDDAADAEKVSRFYLLEDFRRFTDNLKEGGERHENR